VPFSSKKLGTSKRLGAEGKKKKKKKSFPGGIPVEFPAHVEGGGPSFRKIAVLAVRAIYPSGVLRGKTGFLTIKSATFSIGQVKREIWVGDFYQRN